MTQAQFCDRATTFFVWWDQTVAAVIARFEAEIARLQEAGQTDAATALRNRLAAGEQWLAAITSFEDRVKAFCTT